MRFLYDDTGTDTIEKAWVINNEVIELLQEGGFELDKWASNNPELLKDISKQTSGLIIIDSDSESYILGIKWDHFKDALCFHCAVASSNRTSKRNIIFELARLFDPLGLLDLVITNVKLII